LLKLDVLKAVAAFARKKSWHQIYDQIR